MALPAAVRVRAIESVVPRLPTTVLLWIAAVDSGDAYKLSIREITNRVTAGSVQASSSLAAKVTSACVDHIRNAASIDDETLRLFGELYSAKLVGKADFAVLFDEMVRIEIPPEIAAEQSMEFDLAKRVEIVCPPQWREAGMGLGPWLTTKSTTAPTLTIKIEDIAIDEVTYCAGLVFPSFRMHGLDLPAGEHVISWYVEIKLRDPSYGFECTKLLRFERPLTIKPFVPCGTPAARRAPSPVNSPAR